MNNISAMFDGVWAIKESTMAILVDQARHNAVILPAGNDAFSVPAEAAIGHAAGKSGTVAIVPINGPITQKSSFFHAFFGGSSTEGIEAMVRGAVADPNVKAVVLDINSPGGSVYGVEQAADTIRSSRGKGKPIVAIANSVAASAAYWLGSQADELYVAPGAEVGSIGVFSMHVDLSGALEQEGVKVTFIQAGKHKTEGNPYQPLSDDAKADAQASVDRYYSDFVKAVGAGRGVPPATVRDKFGEGRMFGGPDAVARGMADKVGTMSDVLSRLGAGSGAGRRKADLLRMKMQVKRGWDAS